MKRMVMVAALLAMTGSAFAADMPLKAVKAPPPAPFDPWDIAFGSAVMSDYVFRGVTQSNHNPSVAAYFEPRYNVTPLFGKPKRLSFSYNSLDCANSRFILPTA